MASVRTVVGRLEVDDHEPRLAAVGGEALSVGDGLGVEFGVIGLGVGIVVVIGVVVVGKGSDREVADGYTRGRARISVAGAAGLRAAVRVAGGEELLAMCVLCVLCCVL